MIFGREEELQILNKHYQMRNGQLVIVYGRRRIGKSFLIKEFSKSKFNLHFEGLEGEASRMQITNFIKQLQVQRPTDHLLTKINFDNWNDVFYYLTQEIIDKHMSKAGKLVLFFDELQWMAAGRSRLISLIKYFWDNHWKDKGVMLILCGSLASFMVDKVINSKALYGRCTLEMHIRGLPPNDAAKFFRGKRSKHEILKYLMIFGTVPKYLELINVNNSFRQNLNALCFSESGYLFAEIHKVFYKQFREADTYLQIVKSCKDQAVTLKAIANKLKQESNGGLKRYINNLCNADILQEYSSFGIKTNSKDKRYKVTDEFILFYYKYIAPNLTVIKQSRSKRLFEELCENHWQPWLGLAFERFCIKNAGYISERLGFADDVTDLGPLIIKGKEGFQIDYLFKKSDSTIVLCEIKYHDSTIGTEIIPEIERKLQLLKKYSKFTIEKVLITVNGITEPLKQSEYFHQVLDINDLLVLP